MNQAVRPEQHGTTTGYSYGCRCEPCRRARSRSAGKDSLVTDCASPNGAKSSACITLASRFTAAENEFRRVARMANRSEKAFARYRDDLEHAKAKRDEIRAQQDEHATECDAAAVRFGAA